MPDADPDYASRLGYGAPDGTVSDVLYVDASTTPPTWWRGHHGGTWTVVPTGGGGGAPSADVEALRADVTRLTGRVTTTEQATQAATRTAQDAATKATAAQETAGQASTKADTATQKATQAADKADTTATSLRTVADHVDRIRTTVDHSYQKVVVIGPTAEVPPGTTTGTLVIRRTK